MNWIQPAFTSGLFFACFLQVPVSRHSRAGGNPICWRYSSALGFRGFSFARERQIYIFRDWLHAIGFTLRSPPIVLQQLQAV
jgi:hypothetical protein